jgi:hypothetical protein
MKRGPDACKLREHRFNDSSHLTISTTGGAAQFAAAHHFPSFTRQSAKAGNACSDGVERISTRVKYRVAEERQTISCVAFICGFTQPLLPDSLRERVHCC